MKRIAIFFCLVFSMAIEGQAARFATVTVDKAIVYADIQMTAPIGYLVRGKKIRIGDVSRNKGLLYPFVLNKKIVYIEKKNIATAEEIVNIRTATERVKEQAKVKEDTVVGIGPILRLQRFSYNSGYGDMKSDVFLMTGVSISSELNHYRTRESRMISLNYLSGTKGEQTFSETNLSFEFGYQLASYSHFIFRPKLGLILIPYAQYKLSDLFQKNGYGVGGSFTLDTEIKFTDKWGFILGVGYNYSQYFGFDLPSPYPSDFKPMLAGYEAALRVQYHF